MSLNLAKLEQIKARGGKIEARCPACAESGLDATGNHLFVLENGLGKWGCVVNAGDAGKDHRRRIAELVGNDRRQPAPYRPAPAPRPRPTCKPAPRLPDPATPTADKLATIARVRGWTSPDGMEVLVERGQLFTANIFDDGQSWPAWVATDPTRANAQARRMDGMVWTGIGAKAKSLPRASATRVIGASCIGNRPEVWLMEGTPDLLAAPIVARLAGLDLDQIAFVCITGAGNSLHPDDLPHFTGKRIVIAMHNDAHHGKGAEAAHRWAGQLYSAGADRVEGFSFKDGCKDLADHLQALGGTPKGYCSICWGKRIVAPVNGPTCSCRPYVWPVWTPEQLAADTSLDTDTQPNTHTHNNP